MRSSHVGQDVASDVGDQAVGDQAVGDQAVGDQAVGPSESNRAVSRPVPPLGIADKVRTWVEWFGLTRLVTSAVSVVIVCAGGFWLLRAPAPPSESTLPFAAPVSSSPAMTLAPPATAAPISVTPANPLEATESSIIVVHIAGAVEHPGVYRLDAGMRVNDAIGAAGGALVDADNNALNLAAPLADGTRVYVPAIGEEITTSLITEALPAATADSNGVDGPTGPIDVNRATEAELETLPGVGPATALAIIAERDGNGPFASVDDLDRVPGIGAAKVAALRDLVTT